MKFGGRLISGRIQLQWVALLAIAVVLPTVSLLWFMSRVVANERLVVQQKLAALYQDKLTDATARTDTLFADRLAGLDRLKPAANHYALFRRLVLEDDFQGLVVWDEAGAVVYPQSADVANSVTASDSPLAEAWQLEFAKGQYAEAAQLYDGFSADADPRLAVTAIAGKSRCLARLGRYPEAIEACQKAAFDPVATGADPASRLAVESARLLLLSLIGQSGQAKAHAEVNRRTIKALCDDLYNSAGDRDALPANQNLFIAKKVLEVIANPPGPSGTGQGASLSAGVQRGENAGGFRIGFSRDAGSPGDSPSGNGGATSDLELLVAAEELSFAAAESLSPLASQFDVFFHTRLGDEPAYGLRHRIQSSTLLVLLSRTGIASALAGYDEAFSGSEAAYRVLDAAGNLVAGAPQPAGKPFVTAALPEGFPGWKVELYFQGGDVFEKAARRQIAVYIWTALLVIVLILIAGGFATRAVSRQIRLNTMKNDFIATVSHELKTPLASMRVLIDTLLEGNVRDEAQTREYLRLAAKENERLSRMIDNFLTFSRMERNKVAFTLAEARPAAIARDAVESVQTKYAAHHCQLTVEVADPLPELQADHDAIVTVLVNLLDNACKYTTDNKQVALRVFARDDAICFAVSDNGIGLARRHLRRIFDRFYQVDSSLARKAEGCGLGLSIVKFIIDAHKGSISVESRVGKGSTFTVRLPAGRRSGD